MPNPKVRTLTIGGVTYDLQDNISGYITGITSSDVTTALGFTPYNATNPNGYTSNTGTITSVKTTAGAHTTINVSSGAANFNVPTKTSHLTNDSGFLTSYTETDPTVPSWAKQSSKPSYALSEINGTDDLCVIEGLTGTTGLLKKTAANTWTLDTNTYLTSYTETDPTVPSWAKQSSKPTYTAAEVGALPDSTAIPSKVSDLTNDSGFITSYTDEKVKTDLIPSTSTTYYLTLSSSGSSQTDTLLKASELSVYYTSNSIMKLILGKSSVSGMIRLYGSGSYYIDLGVAGSLSANRSIALPNKDGTIALTSDIPTVPTKVSDFTNDSGFISSYTETDPVFSASAAAGITSTDISNWNAKVSDTGKWNGVELANWETATANDYYVPAKTTVDSTSGTASWLKVTRTPGNYSIAQYDNGYLKSTTPSANDNSTKVATTAYVDAAIPKVYSSTNTGGYLTMATLPIYDGTVV